ncbi:MAG: DUF1641 domain-containing protein [Saccharolobus sp.]
MSTYDLSSLDRLLEEEKLSSLNSLLDVITDFNKTGILDVVKGILEDEETLGKIISSLTSDKMLNLISNWQKLLDSINIFISDENIDSINFLFNLLNKIKKSGIVDPILGILEDEETLGKIINGIINDFTLNLISHWNQIVKDLSNIDLENFKYYTLLVSATGEALKSENVKPIKGIWELYKLLKDPDIQRGLGVLVSVLKHIGKLYTPEKGLAIKIEQSSSQ